MVPDRRRKSSGSEATHERNLATPEEVEAGVMALAAEVWGWCENTGRSVALKLRCADFQQLTRSRTLSGPIAGGQDLTFLAIGPLRGLYLLAREVRLLGVTVSGFDAPARAAPAQASLNLG